MKEKRLFIRAAAACCAFPLMQIFAQETSVTIEVLTTFEYPDNSRSTFPQKINEAGDIAGFFYDERGARRGFVRFHDGRFSPPITEPNDNLYFTQVTGINNSHALCGIYETQPDYVVHGFFLSGTTFTEFDIAGARNTWVFALNDVGTFGGYIDTTTGSSGFLNIGGNTTLFSVAGAAFTDVHGLNNLNQCVGSVSNGTSAHGFFRDADGTAKLVVDPPDAIVTSVNGINDGGWMVGYYRGRPRPTHALFFRSPTKFVIYDYPGAVETIFTGINGQRLICGYWDDGTGNTGYGILARVNLTPSD